jgi:hypothetical protein
VTKTGTGAQGYNSAREYGALALQVEWWATDQQPVMVKMMSVNPNCGLRTVKPSGIDLGSGKGNKIKGQHLGMWNCVRTDINN